ncbi:MAG: hypothetical protein KatS3mg053_1084 [Candidatus Roseilinea sp.]|nr:MAG: hypothetical protein KatS3mg053_1084 [Candidatus Roseilinea sp.]
MAFTINDLQDLTRLLATRPEWLSEVRRLVLTEELLSLPDIVRSLAEAQRRTEQRVEELAEAQRRTDQRLEELAEAQRRTEQRVEELAEALQELAEAQRRTEETVRRLVNQMAEVRGDLLEMKFRDKAHAYFGRWLRRARVVPFIELEEQLEDKLTDDELVELSLTDILVRGRPRLVAGADEVWLTVEVSSVVDANDVSRAQRRAALLRRAGLRAVPVAVGARIIPQARSLAETLNVALMRDGTDEGWERAYQAATQN